MERLTLKDGSKILIDSNNAVMTDAEGKQLFLDHSIFDAYKKGYFDAEGAFFFQRELEYVKAKSYDVQYANLKARELFPVSNEGGEGINTITYTSFDQVGIATIINSYAKDLGRADVAGKEVTIPVRTLATSYGYNVDEIASARVTGRPLEARRASAARRAIEQLINNIAFFGNSENGMPGLFSNPNIPTGAVVNPGSGTEWVNKTPDQVLFDINDLFADVFEGTKMVEMANTLLLPPAQWSYIMSTARSANSDTTIAQYIVNNSPYINSTSDIIALNECAAANNPLLATDAMVAYDRSPDKLQLEIPLELSQMPPEQKGLEFEVAVRSRMAGLNVYYPLSLAIATGI